MGGVSEWRDDDEAVLVLSVGPEGKVYPKVPVKDLRARTRERILLESGTDEEHDLGELAGTRDSKLRTRAGNGLTDREINRGNRQGRRFN